MKPDPKAYLHACEVTGLQAGDILFIDDLALNVEAAESLGMLGHVASSVGEVCDILTAKQALQVPPTSGMR